MRRIMALWFMLLAAPLEAQPVIPLTQASVPIAVAAATTQLVAGVTGQSIYVTAVSVITGAAGGNVQFISGTGAACGTGTANVTGTYAMAANGGMTFGAGTGVVLVVPQGASLCVITSAATAGSVAYARF